MYATWGVDDVVPYVEDAAVVACEIVATLHRPSARRGVTDACIGRATQQVAMEQALNLACHGHGTVVLCSGEAGSGKTRGSRWLVGAASVTRVASSSGRTHATVPGGNPTGCGPTLSINSSQQDPRAARTPSRYSRDAMTSRYSSLDSGIWPPSPPPMDAYPTQ